MHFPKTPYPRINQNFLPLQIIPEENQLSQKCSHSCLHFKEAAGSDSKSPKSNDFLNEIVKDYYNLSNNGSLGKNLLSSSIIANKRKTTYFQI